jgi:hypothetical protein
LFGFAGGGYEISEAWQHGKPVSVTGKNVSGDGHCRIRYGNFTTEFVLPRVAEKTLNATLK